MNSFLQVDISLFFTGGHCIAFFSPVALSGMGVFDGAGTIGLRRCFMYHLSCSWKSPGISGKKSSGASGRQNNEKTRMMGIFGSGNATATLLLLCIAYILQDIGECQQYALEALQRKKTDEADTEKEDEADNR